MIDHYISNRLVQKIVLIATPASPILAADEGAGARQMKGQERVSGM
jgi:hypothetical protein